MLPDEEILHKLDTLCSLNEYSQFDISVSILNDYEEKLHFEDESYFLNELMFSLSDIERLERNNKIHLVKAFLFKELSKTELSRVTYSLIVPDDSVISYRLPSESNWTPLPIIAFIGGFLTCVMAIVMVANRVNLVGYDTYYGGGYGYHVLTPTKALILGILLLLVGFFTMPRKK